MKMSFFWRKTWLILLSIIKYLKSVYGHKNKENYFNGSFLSEKPWFPNKLCSCIPALSWLELHSVLSTHLFLYKMAATLVFYASHPSQTSRILSATFQLLSSIQMLFHLSAFETFLFLHSGMKTGHWSDFLTAKE